MEEENKIVLAVEEDVVMDVKLSKEEIDTIETCEDIGVEMPTEIEIDVTEVAGVVSGAGSSAEHEHVISQIKNLESTLNKLGLAHEIYSTGGGIAEFRQWFKKDNPTRGVGYFVGLVHSNTAIDGNNTFVDICDTETTDVYGVTVLNSGMCGYQDDQYCLLDPTHNKENALYSDPPYVKVCLLGVVHVRVYTTDEWDRITPGDYVIPDKYGCAAKSTNNVGFRVISKGNASTQNDSWHYVAIALVPQSDNLARVMKELEGARVDLENISLTIGDLTNKTDVIINEKLKEIDEIVKNTESSVNTKLETTQATLDKVQDIATQSQATIDKVSTQYTNALGSITEARDNANSALEDISKVRENMEYFINNESTIEGFFKEDSTDKSSRNWLLQKTTENGTGIAEIKTEVDENGVTIRHLASYADRYTIGKYSPTYKLSYAEAIGALDNKEYIYVPTKTDTEKSYIYNCTLKNDIVAESTYIFYIENTTYLFNATKGFKYNYEDTTKNIISFNLRKNELIIGEEKFHISATTEVPEGAEVLIFENEWATSFVIGNVYVWTKDEQDNGVYYWKEIDGLAYKLFSSIEQPEIKPSDNGGDGYLWYCANGVWDDSGKIIYQPGTLYRWTAYSETTGTWIAVATVNDGNSRTMSYIEQTEESITSTVTNVRGDVSEVKQTVNNIESSVANVKGELSSINQTAKDIVMGVYEPGGSSSSLDLLLSGLQSTAYHGSHVKVGEFDGSTSSYDGNYYTYPPSWSENGFEFKYDSSSDGAYYFNSDNNDYYCKKTGDTTYEVYTTGNQAMANLSTRVDDNESSIESWTKFQTDVGQTISSITQSSTEDAAEILSMVFGSSVYRENIFPGTLQWFDSADKYINPPTFKDEKFSFEEDAKKDNENGEYCISKDDNAQYYKLLFDDTKNIVGYEIYKLKSHNYSSIMQKTDTVDGKSSISLVAGNEKVSGNIFVDVINDNATTAGIAANRITLSGTTTFEDILAADKTTISGDYIRTGIITSNNYNGPAVYCRHGVKIDNNKIVAGEASDCIYFSLFNDALIKHYNIVPNIKSSIYYKCEDINVGAILEPMLNEDFFTWNISDNGRLDIYGVCDMPDYSLNGTPWNTISSDIYSIYIYDGLTSISEDAFSYCENLNEVTIPSSITSIGKLAFYGCDNLMSVYIEDLASWCNIDFDGRPSNPLYYAGKLYVNNNLIKEITIGQDVSSVKKYAFYNCNTLTHVTISGDVVKIGLESFRSCSNLMSVIIKSGVKSIDGYSFYDCNMLTNIIIPNSVTMIGSHVFENTVYYNDDLNWEDGVLYINNHLIKARTDISNEYIVKTNTKTIAGSAFLEHGGLTKIFIPDSVVGIGDGAFEGCKSLTEINIPDSVTRIGSELFRDCTELTTITLPSSVTEIGERLFQNCGKLTCVIMPEGTGSIGAYMFYGCTSLEDVFIPTGVTIIDRNAFDSCKSLTAIEIPNSVTRIGEDAFYNCKGLTSIEIPDSVTSIGDYAFSGCYGLTTIEIPSSVTSINKYTFAGCVGLTKITIPKSIKTIESKAFLHCDNLIEVYYTGSEEEWNSIVIYNGNETLQNATISFLNVDNIQEDFIDVVSEINDVNLDAEQNISGIYYIVNAENFSLNVNMGHIVGTKFDLNEGTIYSKNLTLDENGNLSIIGKITATSGYIGNKVEGFEINYDDASKVYYISYNQDSYDGGLTGIDEGVYISPKGIGLGHGYFRVDNYGNMGLYKTDFTTTYMQEDPSKTGLNISMTGDSAYVSIAVHDSTDNSEDWLLTVRRTKRIDFYAPIYLNGTLIHSSSDSRLKTNIFDVNTNAIDLLNKIELKSFDWIKTGRHVDVGIIAQQLESILPELVVTDEETGLKSITYIEFIPYIIKAIQELSEIVSPSIELLSLDEDTHWTDNMTEDEKQYYVKLGQPGKTKRLNSKYEERNV